MFAFTNDDECELRFLRFLMKKLRFAVNRGTLSSIRKWLWQIMRFCCKIFKAGGVLPFLRRFLPLFLPQESLEQIIPDGTKRHDCTKKPVLYSAQRTVWYYMSRFEGNW